MSDRFQRLLQRALAEQLGQPVTQLVWQYESDFRFSSNTVSGLYTGSKSIVLTDHHSSAIKIYYAKLPRDLQTIASNYQASYRENPDLFPEVELIGSGNVPSMEIDFICLRQKYLHIHTPEYDFLPTQWDAILDKWDRLRTRQTQALSKELDHQLDALKSDSFAAYEAISQNYFDGFASYQAPFGWRQLCRQKVFGDFQSLEFPEPSLSSMSKIIGDISPKHVLADTNYLAFDLEKYGWGDAAKDLSTIFRYYLYRDDISNAEHVTKYLAQRYRDSRLLYRTYLAALGSGSRLLNNSSDKRALERYRKVLMFYDIARSYFKNI